MLSHKMFCKYFPPSFFIVVLFNVPNAIFFGILTVANKELLASQDALEVIVSVSH